MLKHIEIEGAGPGVDKFTVDGVDLLREIQVVGVSVVFDPMGPPRVYVQTLGDVRLDLEGVVVQEVGRTRTSGPGIAGWLRSLDPDALTAEVLGKDSGFDESPTKTTLEVLAEWAERGDGG